MRHLVLALMIALLPIRGWVGDVMATEMASSHSALLTASKTIADHAHPAGAEGHFDHESATPETTVATLECAGHGGDESHDPASGAPCESCPACQACHTVALSSPMSLTPRVLAVPSLPQSPAIHFASAAAVLGQKPPIS